MGWSEQLTTKLKELCYEGKSNKEIASILRCGITDVYAKRSQLGITINKCKGIKPPPELGLHKEVKKAFAALCDAVLLTMASDYTSERDTELYAQMARVLDAIEESYNALIRLK